MITPTDNNNTVEHRKCQFIRLPDKLSSGHTKFYIKFCNFVWQKIFAAKKKQHFAVKLSHLLRYALPFSVYMVLQ